MIVKTEYEKISASPTLRAFSPNGDGYADINDIKLFSSSKEGLIGWDLAILDQNNDVVRAYGGEKDFSDTISFDGKYTDGRVLPDGLYSVRFRLLYDTGNHPEAFFKFVRVDNTSPEISLSTNITAFSPNGDGVKDTMSIVHEIASEEEDVFEAKILNAAGATFKTFKYGSVPPETVVWDGMGDNNTQPVEGVYTYRITGKDSVGNYKSAEIGPIKLATGFEEVSVEPNFFVFSPEGDGTKDTVSFSLNTTSKEGVIEWKFDIRDRDGRLVRTYNDKNMGIDLPPEVIWDGQNDAETVVPNGIYTATLTMLYDTGNNPISKPKDVKLDTQPPVIEIVVEELNISPNDDGAKETLTIYQNIRGGEDDTYIGEIADFSRNVVRRFEWKGNPPVEIVWDGRNEQGIPLPEGLYTYTVSGQDAAGNRESQTISNIVLTTTYETVSLTASEEGISPNNDGLFESMELQSSISSVANLEAWRLILVNSQGQRVRVFESAGTPPEKISWDGTDDAGNIVPDGEYAFALGLLYSTGNHPMSETGTIIVDTTPPAYRFVISPQLFSPDNDGESDTMYINVEVDDRNGVTGWEIIHYRVWDDRIDYSIPFKQFSGEGKIKQTINWDGYSDPVPMSFGFAPPDAYTYRRSGNRWEVLVDSASSYTAELRATDRFRNEIQVQREYRTDILVIKTAEGLKIMINSIEFEFDKSDLLPQSFSILDRLIQILDKFPAYKVKVVGHTDAVGSDEYNQKLSERRAFSVYKYLVANDVAKERLTTEGRGETQPIDDNETEAGRARNRRVEFFLTK
jgi:outer membrane protein OmpA-like peptidoglycan-associated protein/flagellar hook assembly protein FlgD